MMVSCSRTGRPGSSVGRRPPAVRREADAARRLAVIAADSARSAGIWFASPTAPREAAMGTDAGEQVEAAVVVTAPDRRRGPIELVRRFPPRRVAPSSARASVPAIGSRPDAATDRPSRVAIDVGGPVPAPRLSGAWMRRQVGHPGRGDDGRAALSLIVSSVRTATVRAGWRPQLGSPAERVLRLACAQPTGHEGEHLRPGYTNPRVRGQPRDRVHGRAARWHPQVVNTLFACYT